MGKKEKLIEKMKSNPKGFTYDDLATLLGCLSFHEGNKGKTSGSRVAFVNEERNIKILLHKPHPRKELPAYQVKQVLETLEQEGLI